MSKKINLKCAAHMPAIRRSLAKWADRARQVGEAVAEFAEPPMEEFRSADCVAEFLTEGGFKVTRPWKQLPTAFKAVVGKGRPRIALMAEYDALPDCGPKPGQYGHGCGHNLLGAASAMGGILAAEILRKTGCDGQVIVFGTPAEEILSGKVIMAELGAFRGLDAVIAWHPHGRTNVHLVGGQAMDSLSLYFHGQTAHAAACPDKGRSALDAAILTDVAVNYLREHIVENARIHSVIADGGKAPNVVPDRSQLWYYVRARDRKQVDELTHRLILCARGAAMATETKVSVAFHDSLTEQIPNRMLAETLDAVIRRAGPVKITPADRKAADKVLPGKTDYVTKIKPIDETLGRASSDETNVSWFAPMVRFNCTTGPQGVRAHHRENALIVRTPGAYRGMRKAAEIMAAGVVEFLLNRPVLNKAREEFKQAMKGKVYKLPPRSKRRPTNP